MKLIDYLNLPEQSQSALAKRIGVSQSAVSQWIRDGVSAERVRQIVQATDGVVTAHELRPDLYPSGFVFPDGALSKKVAA